MSTSYKDSRVWQSSMQLVIDIYQLTAGLPPAERLGLSANLQRAATTIPTLIAGGSGTRSQLLQACQAAQAATAELETLLTITGQIYPNVPTNDVMDQVEDVRSLLSALAQRLGSQQARKVV